jgi:hypothetical protein
MDESNGSDVVNDETACCWDPGFRMLKTDPKIPSHNELCHVEIVAVFHYHVFQDA